MEDLNGPWLFDSMYADDPEASKLAALPGMVELLDTYPSLCAFIYFNLTINAPTLEMENIPGKGEVLLPLSTYSLGIERMKWYFACTFSGTLTQKLVSSIFTVRMFWEF